MLKAEGKITDVIIENMMNWPPARRALSLRLGERHSGFNVYCGNAIWPHNESAGGGKIWRAEHVRRRRIIRASFSQDRMTYIAADQSADSVAKVIYQSKDGTSTKTFDALDWLVRLRRIRYYGFYSNKSRGLRKKAGTDMMSLQRPARMIT
jgi:hypothetical protein